MRESDTVARLGGDEFSIILEGIISNEDAMTVVKKVLKHNQEPYALNGRHASLSVSIGIALYPDDAESHEELVQRADQAMYVAKANGKNGFSFYSQGDNRK